MVKGWREALRFMRHWVPRMMRGFFDLTGLEPLSRRLVIGEWFRRELLMTIFEALDPEMAKTENWLEEDPVDDTYLAVKRDSLLKVDLDSPQYDYRFTKAPVYRRRPLVWAIRIMRDAYMAGRYAAYRLERVGSGSVYSYNFGIPYIVVGDDGELQLKYHQAHGFISEGEWLVQDPEMALNQQRDTRFYFRPMDDDSFQRDYELTHEGPNQFRHRHQFKAIRNPTGEAVVTQSVLGDGYGDAWCRFVMPYDPERPQRLAWHQRYPVAWWWFDQFLQKRSRIATAIERKAKAIR